MKRWVQFGVALSLAGLACTAETYSKPLFSKQNPAEAVELGKALPPQGYVKFCGTNQDECKYKSGKAQRLVLSNDVWGQIEQVNHLVNTMVRPTSDIELYGQADKWTYPAGNAGDCEDYVLLKKKLLQGLGFSADELLITVVLDENREGHAILTVMTEKGDFVLDNRRTEILRWDNTGYTFLKRQSQTEATQWVSLQKGAPKTVASTKSE